MGLELLNGNKEDNEQEEWTFAGTLGSSVIDYAIYNAEAWDVTEEFKVGERTKLDHMPLELILQITAEMEIEQEIEKEEEKEIEDQSEEGVALQRKLKEKESRKKGIQEEWDQLVEEVRKAMCKRVIRIKKSKIEEKKWWDKECRESKKRLNRVLRQMKRGKIERRGYTEERQKHNSYAERSREKKEKKSRKR